MGFLSIAILGNGAILLAQGEANAQQPGHLSANAWVNISARNGTSASGGFLRRGRSRHQGSIAMKTNVIGVMPQEQIRARAIAIANGE